MRNYLLLPLLFALGSVFAQEATFTVNVNNDSILLGNRFSVTFSLQNGQGEDFSFPEFAGFVKVGGPNWSSQMNIINGAVSQSVQYTYFLEAHEIGDYYIEPASVKVEEHYLETPPILVRVFPNPDGIIQTPPSSPGRDSRFFGQDFFGQDFFGQDFFGQDFGNPGGIFDQELLGDDFFEQFFQQVPFGQMIPPSDSLQQVQPQKRKTTRI